MTTTPAARTLPGEHLPREAPLADTTAWAQGIAAACERALIASGLRGPAVERLLRYACRHLPLDESVEGSPFVPPFYAMRVAEHLGLPPALAVDFAAAGGLFFAAADLADDCADGDVRRTVGLDVNDTCHLLFAQQHRMFTLDVAPAVRCALGVLFAEAGQEMAVGQALDLLGTDAINAADPLTIALGKTGGELAAFFAGPAVLAQVDPEPWRAFGRAFGALVQVLTDYFDLFLDPTSDDWDAAKPTVPLRFGMRHPAHGAELRQMLAGDRSGADRKAMGLWLLTQSGVGDELDVVLHDLLGRMQAAEAALDHPAVLRVIREEIEEWCGGVIDALKVYVWDSQPPTLALSDEIAAARTAAYAFLAADPALAEATEVHRHGLFDAPEVRGGLFGRALAIDALRTEPVNLDAAWTALLKLADPDGWRYYPGHRDLPTDVDCIGVMMQLCVLRPALRRHPAMAQGAALMRRPENLDDDGLMLTWLADGATFDRAGIDAIWAGGSCPGAAANALVGLWRWGGAEERDWVRARVPVLAERLMQAHESVFYPAAVVDYMVVRCLLEVGSDDARVGAAIAVAAARARARRTVSGRMGDVLSTAMGAWILARTGTLDRPAEVQRALVDAQHADGGYADDPLYVTVPHPVTTNYASRVVTTAYVLQALRAME